MLSIRAHAKINLSLDIIGKRPDGYHDLSSVMQSIRLHDEVTLRSQKEITVRCDLRFLPCDNRNIAWKAARLFMDELQTDDGIGIQIKKHIPVGGGLGGGSADAAAVLMGLNRMYGFPVTFDRLLQLGLACGADVPFCMTGGTCLAEGLGERLMPLPSMPHCHILLLRPRFSLSTKKMFGLVDVKKIKHHPDTRGLINALNNRDAEGVTVRMFNCLEAFAPRLEIREYKQLLLDEGAKAALMTGSGSVVYGIFSSFEKAASAKERFSAMGLRPCLTAPVPSIF
ncbi:MAG: 4-(cytidine 5'-diphospho)-2-C-methyl-D-erythritol kinase [Clostridia bacterium]|nr:4-(cytidine 5'-diphospho)-2-C-methyl-D-erythritol kinase [Clostridia bacterium]